MPTAAFVPTVCLNDVSTFLYTVIVIIIRTFLITVDSTVGPADFLEKQIWDVSTDVTVVSTART